MSEDFGLILLSVAEAIRRRPAMYLGDTRAAGLHRMVFELVDYSVVAHANGECTHISAQINDDGSLAVSDDGPGISVEMHPDGEMTVLEWVMRYSTGVEMYQGKRKFRPSSHGAGVRAVMALSDWAEVMVSFEGRLYRQRYEKGETVGDVSDIGPANGRTGTTITFHPDPEIFADTTFDWHRLEERLSELAYLNRKLTTHLSDERKGKADTFHYLGGIVDLVKSLNQGAQVLHQPFHVEKTINDVQVEIAVQFTAGKKQNLRCYANNVYNRGGGTHQAGFLAAMTRVLRRFGGNLRPLGLGPTKANKEICPGLTAVVNIQHLDPQFESFSKTRLNNPDVESIVAKLLEEEFTAFLEGNEDVAHRIMSYVGKAARS